MFVHKGYGRKFKSFCEALLHYLPTWLFVSFLFSRTLALHCTLTRSICYIFLFLLSWLLFYLLLVVCLACCYNDKFCHLSYHTLSPPPQPSQFGSFELVVSWIIIFIVDYYWRDYAILFPTIYNHGLCTSQLLQFLHDTKLGVCGTTSIIAIVITAV